MESAPTKYHAYRFSGKVDNFNFFRPNLYENEFWGKNFKNLSPDSKSAHPIYHGCLFSSKTDCFDSLSSNLPKNKFRVGNSEN